MGLIYPFMLCVCVRYVHDFIAGEYTWQDEGGRLFSCNFIRSGRFSLWKQKWLWFFVASTLQCEKLRETVYGMHWHKSEHKTTDKSTYGLISPLKIIAIARSVSICTENCITVYVLCTEIVEQVKYTQTQRKRKKNKQRIILPPLSLDTIFSMFFLFFHFECYCYRCVLNCSLPFLSYIIFDGTTCANG